MYKVIAKEESLCALLDRW